MQIVNVKQGSQEWHDIRALRISASHAQTIQANGKGLETYTKEKVCEYFSTAPKDGFTNRAMEHGIEQEPVAVTMYEFKTGYECFKIGYVIHNDHVGCSPDRGCCVNGLVEIKCPTDKVYFQYLLDGKIDLKYYYQMQMQMLVCGKEWCDYVVYNPNFEKELIIQRVEPDEKIYQKLLAGFETGTEMIGRHIKRYKEVLAE
jgi:putative phage-type endonuclease